MKRFITVLFVLLTVCQMLRAKDLVLEGFYQGENLFINNPFTSTGVTFCIYEVIINGKPMTDGINSSSFEIDFPSFDIYHGDQVKVILKHRDGCSPKILNKCAIQPNSTFRMKTISVSVKDLKLEWITTGESAKLPYIIEQYRWNKWITVGEVMGIGTPNSNDYKADIRLHTGTNRFRVKQMDCTGRPKYSLEATARLPGDAITFSKVKNAIVFSAPTDYEIFDAYAVKVMNGYTKEVDITNLKKGEYFMNYDNEMSTFTK